MHYVANTVQESPTISEFIGAIAAAFAIGAGLFGTATWLFRHLRRHKLLKSLRQETREVRGIDDSLRDATWKMELLFSSGFPWAGYAIFTGEIGDHLNTLQRLARETQETPLLELGHSMHRVLTRDFAQMSSGSPKVCDT